MWKVRIKELPKKERAFFLETERKLRRKLVEYHFFGIELLAERRWILGWEFMGLYNDFNLMYDYNGS